MKTYILRLSFDPGQVTQSLAYQFLLVEDPNFEGKQPYPMEAKGPLAGTFNFQEKDQVFVEVVTNIQNFFITNCTLVSVPARMTEFISMFDHTSACSSIEDWDPVRRSSDDAQFLIRSTKPLEIVTQNGQWQISGYLSVQLPAGGQTPSEDGRRHQLYYFDPEGSAGAGGGWNF